MRKYHIADLDVSIPHVELYDKSLKTPPGISAQRVREVWLNYSDILSEKRGNLLARADELLAEMAGSERFADAYVIVPMNMLLWLYEKGNSIRESEKLFITLARRSRDLYSSKSVKSRGRRINLENMPISRRFRGSLASLQEWKERSNRTFTRLQGLITVLACAVRGREASDSELVHTILNEAAPGTVGTLKAPEVCGKGVHMYSAIYTGVSEAWNVLLLKTCPASEVMQLMRGLIWRMQNIQARNDSKRSRKMSPIEFYTRLMSWLELSVCDDPMDCMDMEKLAGSIKLW